MKFEFSHSAFLVGMYLSLALLYFVNMVRTTRYRKAMVALHEERIERHERLVKDLDAAADTLQTAGIALCAAMHCHYHVDDEALPGLKLVTCQDCGESLGSVTDPGDVLTLANVHVAEKYEAMRQLVKTDGEVKQDQPG